MITYLNKLKPPIINLEDDNYLSDFKRRIERYHLELSCVETTLDFSLTTITAIIRDSTGIGPAVSAGLGGNLDPKKTIINASLEAVRGHISARDRLFRQKPPLPPRNKIDLALSKKQMLWSAPHMLDTIKPFISGPKKDFSKLKNPSSKIDKENAELLINELLKKNYNVFVVDLTTPQVRELGLNVIKVLVPELLPLYHDEEYPYKGNKRLYQVPIELGLRKKMIAEEEINSSHPFL